MDNLAVPLIKDSFYQDKFIAFIQFKARRLRVIDSCNVAILNTFNSSVCILESPEDAQPRTVHLSRLTVTSLVLVVPVNVPTFASELRITSQHEGAACKQSFLCANGLVEVVPDQQLTMLVRNFTNAPRGLLRHKTIA